MKKILGLDLGTNSIGWALIDQDFEKKDGSIIGVGSRIIPMPQNVLGNFEAGISISQTADRTHHRSVRRLYQRTALRRDRLHRILNILNFLPTHYAKAIDFEKKYGQFKEGKEVKINYKYNKIKDKNEFLFVDSFYEMVEDFKRTNPELFYLKKNRKETKIPHDWTIYYLRKKALTGKIGKEELAWILLNFNRKRGYHQLRGDEIETTGKKNEEYYSLAVNDVEETAYKNNKGIWYNVILENGWVYKRQSKESLKNWSGEKKEFIITTQIDENGNPKLDMEGNVKRSLRAVNSEKDWIAIKKKTEKDIEQSEKTVGQFIYEALLSNPSQKIQGKLVKTIERDFYKSELETILKKQKEFHPELRDVDLFNKCVEELYPRNEAHQNSLKNKDFEHLLIEDTIFYQRPLKSKKSTISGCPYESKKFHKGGEILSRGIKVIPTSNPYFQEFRVWQFISNLRLYKKEIEENGKLKFNVDVTTNLLPDENTIVELFEFLNTKREIDQTGLLRFFVGKSKINKSEVKNIRWNYVEDNNYKCNETRAQLLNRLKRVDGINDPLDFLSGIITKSEKVPNPKLTREQQLWHIIYSVKNKSEFEKALITFAEKNRIDVESFLKNFIKIPPYNAQYGSYSEKAIKKLLPLMRVGKYWNENDIDITTKERIEKMLDGEHDDNIRTRVREKFVAFKSMDDFKGLPVWLACYAVYDRHSEPNINTKWLKPADIDHYLEKFRQHSLRNPVVEQVIMETLRVVRDIWNYYGNGRKDFFDEIHVELGRDMKNPKGKRKRISERNNANKNTNQRIRELLIELKNDPEIRGEIRPYSDSQKEILKIYEEGIFENPNTSFSFISEDEIIKIRKKSSLSKTEIWKYKLWLEQGYVSPYTGETIPLSELFTENYQIEHILPQSRYFDNSLNNKVICEAAINPNPYKDNQTGYEFIKNMGGQIIPELSNPNRTVKLLSLNQYEQHCKTYFKHNRQKLKYLMSEDIPEGFINRQLNDSRYISKLVKVLMSNIVREENEQDAISKNVVTVVGSITSKLKRDWGLNDKWNEIITPRFKRLNELQKTDEFGYYDSSINAFRIMVPEKIKKDFSKKRIDHRHHALDALVIASCTKDHVNYITSLNTERNNHSLISKLRKVDKIQIKDRQTGEIKNRRIAGSFLKPWANFTIESKNEIEKTIVSFKQNHRVINKTNNKTLKWDWNYKKGKLEKKLVKQKKGLNWAIRKPLHTPLPYGKRVYNFSILDINKNLGKAKFISNPLIQEKVIQVLNQCNNRTAEAKRDLKMHPLKDQNGNEIKFVEFRIPEIRYRKRQPIYQLAKRGNGGINKVDQAIKLINKVADSVLRSDLLNHLQNSNYDIEVAFSIEGIDNFNNKRKIPVYRLPISEQSTLKFPLGHTHNTKVKFGEAESGTNLFFAVYWDEKKQKRQFETVPLNEVIEHQKQVAHLSKSDRTKIPVNADLGDLIFSLSPYELVYFPTTEEIENPSLIEIKNLNKKQLDRIYTVNDFSKSIIYFTPNRFAKSIAPKEVDLNIDGRSGKLKGSFDLKTTNRDGKLIKETCWKLEVDRLGNVIGMRY